jgi:transposase-like protein
MKANVRAIAKRRRYSEEFKKSIVQDFESGRFSVLQLERLHGVSNVTIYKWIYKYSTFNQEGYRVVEKKSSSQSKVRDLEKKIKELEATLGRKQIQIDYLETMMEVAKDELNIDIKKNFATPHSKGSKSAK